MCIVKKRIKQIFVSIQRGIDLFDGMHSKFNASNEWLAKFKKRHGLRNLQAKLWLQPMKKKNRQSEKDKMLPFPWKSSAPY